MQQGIRQGTNATGGGAFTIGDVFRDKNDGEIAIVISVDNSGSSWPNGAMIFFVDDVKGIMLQDRSWSTITMPAYYFDTWERI